MVISCFHLAIAGSKGVAVSLRVVKIVIEYQTDG
jgi:hypothetical protein